MGVRLPHEFKKSGPPCADRSAVVFSWPDEDIAARYGGREYDDHPRLAKAAPSRRHPPVKLWDTP